MQIHAEFGAKVAAGGSVGAGAKVRLYGRGGAMAVYEKDVASDSKKLSRADIIKLAQGAYEQGKRTRSAGTQLTKKVARPARARNDRRLGRAMETSLHRDLKRLYAGPEGEVEVVKGPYRIDAIRRELLIEVQHSGLAAIRDKIRSLLRRSRVLVVKPIIALKRIEKLGGLNGPLISVRRSPSRGSVLDFFDELVHFTSVFPHKRLSIEIPMVEVEETRYPGHGRRRRRRQGDYQILDQRLVRIIETHRYRHAIDLLSVLPATLAAPFDTAELAAALSIGRGAAQRIAYCLRTAGATKSVGKRGNSILYRPAL